MSSALRVRFDDPVAFRTEYERNIIQGGVFVPTTQRLELRSIVTVELELAWCGETIHLDAEIVHCTAAGTAPKHAGVAVQFLDAVGELRQRLGPIAAAASSYAGAESGSEPVESDLELSNPALYVAAEVLEPEILDSNDGARRGVFELDASGPPEPDAVDAGEASGVEVPIAIADRGAAGVPVIELDETTGGEGPILDLDETTGGQGVRVDLVEPPPEDESAIDLEAPGGDSGPTLDLEVESDPLAPADTSGVVDSSSAFDPLEGVVERRSAERLTARLPVHVDAAHISLDGRTRDISENGVLLSADGSDLPVGKKVTLALTHPQTGERLTIGGTVARHVESHGTVGAVGIAFDRSLEGDEHLRAFIRDVQAAERARRDAGISGVIEELGMANLLQMFGKSSPCGTLTVSSGSEEGVVAFQQGDLRYVRLGSLRGMKALARLLGWEYGAFEFVSQVDPLPDEGDPLPLEGALLEAVRQIDEAAREEGGEIDSSATLRLDRNALTTLDKPLAQIEEAVLDLAAAGLTVRRLLDVIPEPDGDILGALRTLRDRGLVILES